MRGILWLNYFIDAVSAELGQYLAGKEWKGPSDRAWTDLMRRVMEAVGQKTNCWVVQRRPENKQKSGEYLNIDAVFLAWAEYGPTKEGGQWDPFVLPLAVAETENSYDKQKISYSLWKILLVRAPIRALICYQRSAEKITNLRQHLEDVIWQGSLMKGTEGDLLVIIGDDSAWVKTSPGRSCFGRTSLGEYFSVYEWRGDRLEKMEGLEWRSYPGGGQDCG